MPRLNVNIMNREETSHNSNVPEVLNVHMNEIYEKLITIT